MAWTADFLDFLKTAKHPTLMIVGGLAIILAGEFLVCLETSRKDIKFWGVEIAVPESDGIKSCRAIQAAFHDKALGFESERRATYRLMENDEASIDVFTKLQLEARAQDQDPNTHVSDTERAVVWRLNSLVEDANWRQKYVEFVKSDHSRGY